MNNFCHLVVGTRVIGPMPIAAAMVKVNKWRIYGKIDAFIMDAWDRPVTELLRERLVGRKSSNYGKHGK